METLTPNPVMGTAAGVFALLLFCYFLFVRVINQRSSRVKGKAPEVRGGRPFLGHLHLLKEPKPVHIILGDLADTYGPIFTEADTVLLDDEKDKCPKGPEPPPIFTIRLGIYPTLVISDWEVAKECFTTNDKVFANRPRSLAGELLGSNFAMTGFASYGSYWRHTGKIATAELLSNHRLEKLKHILESEIRGSVRDLYELVTKGDSNNSSEKVVVEMKRWFWSLNINIVFRMVLGKRYFEEDGTTYGKEDDDPSRKAMRNFFKLAGAFTVADTVPFLRWLDLGGYEKAMNRTAKELDHMLEEYLEVHKQKRRSGNVEEEHDFMDIMLSLQEDAGAMDSLSFDADTINKATCLGVILGGTDTTTVTLTWALSLLLNHRHILKKVQHELDTYVGKERVVQESDIKNLVYLQAIIKETMRLYPPAPLSVPHESADDCTTGGYFIPAGTRLLTNLSKLQRDPRVWSNPNEFQPDRFLTTHKHVEVRGQNYEQIPFGSGRRMCPGISFALQVLQLSLASLLQAFDITTPRNETVDMDEAGGLTNWKATPLEVVFTPRLPPHLYE